MNAHSKRKSLSGRKLSDEERAECVEWYKACKLAALSKGMQVCDIYKMFGVAPTSVTNIRRGKLRAPKGWKKMKNFFSGITDA